MERHEVLAAAQLRARVGQLAVVQPAVAVVGPRRDLVDRATQRIDTGVVERVDEYPPRRIEMRDRVGRDRVECADHRARPTR